MTERDEERLAAMEKTLAEIRDRLDTLVLPTATADDPPSAAEGRFERRMNVFVILMNVLTAGLTFVFWRYATPFFPVAFGLFFVFLMLAVGLVVDEFVLPTKTFRKISTHAIAVSVFWLSVLFLAVSGVRIGTSIISDPFDGEEGARVPAGAVADAPEPAAPAVSGRAAPRGSGEADDGPAAAPPDAGQAASPRADPEE